MIIFRFKKTAALTGILPALLAFIAAPLAAQRRPVTLEPISTEGVDVVSVRNFYGKCGPSVVQVLGVRQEVGDFYSVDGNADVVVIREGGRQEISLKRFLSDHNGVACVGTGRNKKLLVWSDCAGSACGRGWNFTVVHPTDLKILAGAKGSCNAQCAARITGSRVPLQLEGP